jgi:hypothetical protein
MFASRVHLPKNSSVLLTAACAVFSTLGSLAAQAQISDPVIFSFATVGDSRQDLKSPDPNVLLAVNPATGAGAPSLTGTLLPQDKQWLQNSQAWSLIQNGIQSQNPNLLFFNGDMVYGYGRPTLPAAWANGQPGTWTTAQTVSPDTIFEYVQYAYWRGQIASLFNIGTYVLPVPGNHETQCSNTAAPYTAASPNPNCVGKTAYADNENVFRFNTGDLIQDLVTNIRFSNVTGFPAQKASAPQASTNNGPITGNQAQLSYSFDVQVASNVLLHFAVINTDPSGADSTAPADWLASDFAAAQQHGIANGSAVKYFVFGHKPAFTYNYAAKNAAPNNTLAAAGLDVNVATRNAFWKVVAQYGASYFCGHEHTVNVSQNADQTGTYTSTPYQVIVGSGGSPFDSKMTGTCPSCNEPLLNNPFDRYYAWALVQVHQSGNVSLLVNGFSDTFGPTQELTLYNVPSLQ